MTAGWRARVDRFWAGELGVDAVVLARPGVHVLERSGSDAAPRIVVLGMPGTTVVSITRGHRRRFEDAGARLGTLDVAARAAVAALGRTATTLDVRGPAYLGYWTGDAAPRALRVVRPLDGAAALTPLRATAPSEWEEAGLDDATVLFGARDGDELVAVAGYEPWADLVQLHVFSHPRHRGRGLARDVLAAAVAHALAAGRLPQYRAQDLNVASRTVAERMGFEEYGWMATIRVR
jgi:GNAT superfamily N-acetyltransferase